MRNRKRVQLHKYVAISLKYGGGYAFLTIANRLLLGILPLMEVKMLAQFVDKISLALSLKGKTREVWLSAAGLVFVIAILWMSEKIGIFFEAKLVYRLRERFTPKLIEKCARMKYCCVEEEQIQDKIKRVTKEPEKEIYGGLKEILSLASMAIRIGGIALIIMKRVWWCGAAVLLLHIPILVLSVKNGKNAYQADKDSVKYIRKCEYLDGVLTGRESALERNIFGYEDYVHQMWKNQFEIAASKYLKAFLNYFFAARAYGILSVLVSLGMVFFLIQPVLSGTMSEGLFIAVVSNLLTVVHAMMPQLSYSIRELTRKKSYMEDLHDFVNLPEEGKGILDCPEKEFEDFREIEFRKVSFRYPGTEAYVLRKISFRIEAGKRYAFVGANGAGKTTITKLMLRLYDNYEGEIYVNGRELRQYPLAELKALYAVVYQDFAEYQISVGENIEAGALYMEESQRKIQAEKIAKALELDKDLCRMGRSIDSMLGKLEADNIELSVGQWQRIAIARAMMSRAPVCVLDEPTAALDPLTENIVYEKYRCLCEKKTTVFITHRLGAIRLAEHIFVLDKGKMEAQGTYEELMDSCGRFRTMYETQRGLYE